MREAWPHLVGGNPALDFANTGLAAAADPNRDVLGDLDRFVAWAAHASIDPDGSTAAPSAQQGVAIVRRARLLRAAIVDVMLARAGGEPPPARALAELHRAFSAAIADARPSVDGRLTWSWAHLPAPSAAVHVLAAQAVELLQAPNLDRLKSCDACRFLFLDASRNNSRRWCSMDTCGTQVKMRRFVARRAAANRSSG